jgi:hypothetical protein
MKKSKTLVLMERYQKLLEQDAMAAPVEGDPAAAAPVDPSAVVEPQPSKELPFTSDAENKYLELMVLAAKFKPSVQDDAALDDLLAKATDSSATDKRAAILVPLSKLIGAKIGEEELRDNLDAID